MAGMKLIKTPGYQRNRYVYEDSLGRKYTLVPGENGVTLEDILSLHREDDRYVEKNLEYIHCCKRTEFRHRKEKWLENHENTEDMPRYNLFSYEELYESSLAEISEEITIEIGSDFEKAIIVSTVHTIIDTLSDEEKTIIILRGLNGSSLNEVAEKLGRSPAFVSIRYRRILEKLSKNEILKDLYENL